MPGTWNLFNKVPYLYTSSSLPLAQTLALKGKIGKEPTRWRKPGLCIRWHQVRMTKVYL